MVKKRSDVVVPEDLQALSKNSFICNICPRPNGVRKHQAFPRHKINTHLKSPAHQEALQSKAIARSFNPAAKSVSAPQGSSCVPKSKSLKKAAPALFNDPGNSSMMGRQEHETVESSSELKGPLLRGRGDPFLPDLFGAEQVLLPNTEVNSNMLRCFDPFPRTDDVNASEELDEEKEGLSLSDLEEAMELLGYAMKTAEGVDWAPYKDKNLFLAHLISAIPRHPMSVAMFKLVLKFAEAMGAPNVPSYYAVENEVRRISELVGLQEPLRHLGLNGNIFYTASLANVLKREFANPLCREHMFLYPRRNSGLYEIFDGEFVNKINPESVAPPMVILPKSTTDIPYHAYVHEPVLLRNHSLVWTRRWFAEGKVLYGEGSPFEKKANGVWHVDMSKLVRFDLTDICRIASEFSPQLQRSISTPSCAARAFINPLRTKASGRPVWSVPWKIFCDDLSGNRSKKWNKLFNIYAHNATLESKVQELEGFIRFLATSGKASPLEMASAVVDEFNRSFAEPVEVYDVKLKQVVLVIPWIILVVGDNPMLAELASHIGCIANFPCRICTVGGPKKHKKSEEGFAELLQSGPKRSNKYIISTNNQYFEAARSGIKTNVKRVQEETGVRDGIAHPLVEGLLKKSVGMKQSTAKERDQELDKCLDSILDQAHQNPFLTHVEGFDITQQTPVEILHTILLGIVKYLWGRTVYRIHDDFKKRLQIQLEAASTAGLDAGQTINAAYYIQYAGSLIGKELKILMQVMPWACRPLVDDGLMKEEIWELWRVLGSFTSRLWVPGIPQDEIESYMRDLDNALGNLFYSAARVIPGSITSKLKWHLCVHIRDNIQRFGPAKGFNTEMDEKFNGVARNAFVFSNRMAYSRDTARTMEEQEAIRHIISNGFYFDPVTNGYRQPGKDLIAFIEGNPIWISLYGLQKKHTLVPGTLSFKNKAESKEFDYEVLQPVGLTPSQEDIAHYGFREADALITREREKCVVGDFVHLTTCKGNNTSQENTYNPCIARIRRIVSSQPQQQTQLSYPFDQNFVELECYHLVTTEDEYYKAPVLERLSRRMAVPVSDIQCRVNANHDCHSASCLIQEDGAATRQEREEIETRRKPKVRHNDEGDRIVLNPAITRSFFILKHLYHPVPQPPSRQDIAKRAVRTMAAREKEEAEKAKLDRTGERKRKQSNPEALATAKKHSKNAKQSMAGQAAPQEQPPLPQPSTSYQPPPSASMLYNHRSSSLSFTSYNHGHRLSPQPSSSRAPSPQPYLFFRPFSNQLPIPPRPPLPQPRLGFRPLSQQQPSSHHHSHSPTSDQGIYSYTYQQELDSGQIANDEPMQDMGHSDAGSQWFEGASTGENYLAFQRRAMDIESEDEEYNFHEDM